MYRAFLSLYLLIAVSLLATGWGLDKIWQHYRGDPVTSIQDEDLMRLLELHLIGVAAHKDVTLINQQLNAQTELIPLEDFAQSRMLHALQQGEVVVVNDAAGDKILYQRLAQTGQVIRVDQQVAQPQQSNVYDLLIVAFYAAMALVVLFWIWPLSRDLRKLEKQTRLVGKESIPSDLHLSPASPVRDLADAFNGMANRIRELLVSHQEMTCAVSHELRTPLARMKFGLELAGESDEVVRIHRQLSGVRQDVTEMDRLINQLLSYVSFEQGEQPLNLQPGDMKYLIEHLVAQLTVQYDGEHLTVEFHDRVHQQVVCEWHLMERAVINVLQNACRFARQHIVVTLEEQDDCYCISVEDDGPGIPSQDRERVFNSFVRLTHETQAQTSGFGLGLAIVRRVLTWHKGSVVVTDSSLGGACFELRWPVP